MQRLDFERRLEDATARMIAGSAATVYRSHSAPAERVYPCLLVRAMGVEDAGFEDLGVFSCDVQVTAAGYPDDDPDGDLLAGAVQQAREALLPPGLVDRLRELLPEYTLFAAVNGAAFGEIGLRTREYTLQFTVKFSPTASGGAA